MLRQRRADSGGTATRRSLDQPGRYAIPAIFNTQFEWADEYEWLRHAPKRAATSGGLSR
jgi:hypothetical protein